jgi:hypothetical protein
MRLPLVLAALLVLAVSMEGVVELKDDNFKQEVYAEPRLWLVMFSASWVLLPPLSAVTAPISSPK